MPNRDFDDIVEDGRQQSVQLLYPYLKIAILGPYQGDCYAFLTGLKIRLRDYGFESTMLSTDQTDNIPPDGATEAEKSHFYRREANRLMDNSDVGIFLFLDHTFERKYLSKEALEAAREPEKEPREVNISVSNEIEYWLNNYPHTHAMILVEESIYPDLSSRIQGIELEKVHWENFPNDDIDRVEEEGWNRCRSWVREEFREILWRRYRRSSTI